MAELFKLVLDVFGLFWPFHLVHTWEQGVLYVFGRYQCTLSPGLKLVFPWFMQIMNVSVARWIEKSRLRTVTLPDNTALTYSATFEFQVINPAKAMNDLQQYNETVFELASGHLSQLLSEAPAPERNCESLRQQIDSVLQEVGVALTTLLFDDFVIGVPTLRLLQP